MMHETLVVQHIHISWTKRARGGDLAVKRNQVESAYPVEHLLDLKVHRNQFVVQQICFGERNDFSEPFSHQLSLKKFNEKYEATNCTVEFKNGSPVATYEWRNGAPEIKFFDKSGTPIPVQRTLNVNQKQSVRIEYNCRHTGMYDGIWWYEHSIINVAYVNTLTQDLFLRSPPQKVIRQMSRLW